MRGTIGMWVLLLAGCAPAVEEGYFGCTADSECPTDWVCRADGRCWRTPGEGPLDAGVDGGPDPTVDAGPDGGTDACVPRTEAVDLLVMVDKSPSMAEEQAALSAAFPQLVEALATGDADGDGTRDFAPVGSLRVGVITSDLGALGNMVPTCDSGFGDDAALVTTPSGAVAGCDDLYPRFLEYVPGASLRDFGDDFACVASVGTVGCGFEQQLEATLKAVAREGSSAVFFDGSRPQGDRDNAGFLRDDSLLLALLLTDEEDCSTLDDQLFDPAGPYAGTNANQRCYAHADRLTPVQRYVQGLLEVRDASRLAFAALVGIPPELNDATYPTILSDERMTYDLVDDTRIAPACSATTGTAAPGRRFVEVAQGLEAAGAATMVRSVCTESFTSTIETLLQTIAPRLQGSCE